MTEIYVIVAFSDPLNLRPNIVYNELLTEMFGTITQFVTVNDEHFPTQFIAPNALHLQNTELDMIHFRRSALVAATFVCSLLITVNLHAQQDSTNQNVKTKVLWRAQNLGNSATQDSNLPVSLKTIAHDTHVIQQLAKTYVAAFDFESNNELIAFLQNNLHVESDESESEIYVLSTSIAPPSWEPHCSMPGSKRSSPKSNHSHPST